jgi:hypothetical protein
MLLDIHANVKKILGATEAIPLHLTLDIVRFDDALGESWALPYQACTEWQVSYVLKQKFIILVISKLLGKSSQPLTGIRHSKRCYRRLSSPITGQDTIKLYEIGFSLCPPKTIRSSKQTRGILLSRQERISGSR